MSPRDFCSCPARLRAQHAWTHQNTTYGGMYEALRACERPWYVASSKAAHRISPLLRSLLGVDMDTASPRLFAGLIPPNERKVAALRCAPSILACRAAGTITFRFAKPSACLGLRRPGAQGRTHILVAMKAV